MSYDKTVALAARAELDRRRSEAEERARRNLEDFLQACPRAVEIRRELARNSAEAARAAVSGEGARERLEHRKERGLALRAEYEELLKSRGLSRRDVEPQYACPKCSDTGFADGRMCSCYRELRRSLAYRQLSASRAPTYCKVHVTLTPSLNRELERFTEIVNTAAASQGTALTALRAVIWDGELRQAVSPLERALELMRMLYPVVLALSLLSAAGVAVLFVMLLAKEAAILRVQGTAKIQTILMLSLQQVFTCFSGLTIGLTGILLYIGGTRPDLLPGIAPGTAVCAAAYLAAGVLGAIASSAAVTGKNPLEMLQVKE